MFVLRRVLYFLAIPLVLFLGGSAIAEPFAESQLATGMQNTLDLRTKPSIQIESFPMLLRIAQGRIPRVRVDARAVTVEDLGIEQIFMDMEGVEASLDVLVRQNKFELSVEDGSGFARITERSINVFLARERIDAVVALLADGNVTVVNDEVVAGTRRRFAATGRLSLGGRTLAFTPTRITMDGKPVPPGLRSRARKETTFSVDIPKLPAGIVPGEVVVMRAELKLVANLEGFVLKVA